MFDNATQVIRSTTAGITDTVFAFKIYFNLFVITSAVHQQKVHSERHTKVFNKLFF